MQIRYHEAIRHIMSHKRSDTNDEDAEYKWNIIKRKVLLCVLAMMTFIISILQITTITREDYGDVTVNDSMDDRIWLYHDTCRNTTI